MTLPNNFTAGTSAKAEEVDENFRESNSWNTFLVNINDSIKSLCSHSATKVSYTVDDGEIFQWDNGTVTSRDADLDTTSGNLMTVSCKADRTHAFYCEQAATAETAFTDDSADSVTTKTSIAWGTGSTNAISFPTATLIVVGGDDDAGGEMIKFSTDDAGTWTDATTYPANVVYCLDMYDGTTGYCIDVLGNVFKTTNSAVDWTDTTHGVTTPNNNNSRIYAISATKFLYYKTETAGATLGMLIMYDNATGLSTVILRMDDLNTCLGMAVTDSGTIYVAAGSNVNATGCYYLFRSKDDGVSWAVRTFAASDEQFQGGGEKYNLDPHGTDESVIMNLVVDDGASKHTFPIIIEGN